jgi:hypothetical protein
LFYGSLKLRCFFPKKKLNIVASDICFPFKLYIVGWLHKDRCETVWCVTMAPLIFLLMSRWFVYSVSLGHLTDRSCCFRELLYHGWFRRKHLVYTVLEEFLQMIRSVLCCHSGMVIGCQTGMCFPSEFWFNSISLAGSWENSVNYCFNT